MCVWFVVDWLVFMLIPTHTVSHCTIYRRIRLRCYCSLSLAIINVDYSWHHYWWWMTIFHNISHALCICMNLCSHLLIYLFATIIFCASTDQHRNIQHNSTGNCDKFTKRLNNNIEAVLNNFNRFYIKLYTFVVFKINDKKVNNISKCDTVA